FHQGKARRRGSDYFGRGVNIAARIGAQGEAGQILASSETLAACGDGYHASEPRTVRLKGISEPVEIVSVDWH
ncbi:MAG: adenylate/guanylate cyclase domain-containing protein, partial [Chloroflexi bacterium]|nr:adenylate/guanylate cyclase domain-containing protein [Chloroflexota bacterium]